MTRKLLSFLDPPSRVQLYLLLVPMLVTAVLEVASVGMILPLIAVMFGGGDNNSEMISWLLAVLNEPDPQRLLFLVTLIFAVFFILKNVAFLAMIYIVNLFAQMKLALFRQRMFDMYLHRPYTFHLHRNSAEILRNLFQSTSTAFLALQLMMNLVLEGILVLSVCLLLVTIEPWIMIIVSGVMVAVGLLFYRFMSPMFRNWGERTHWFEARIFQSINQALGAIKVVKVLNCHSFFRRSFSELTDQLALVQSRNSTAQNLPRVLVESVMVILLLGMTVAFLKTHGSVQEVISILGLFGVAALRLMPSINRILGFATDLRRCTAPVDDLYDDLQEGLVDSEKPVETEDRVLLPFNRAIQMENLSYAYGSKAQEAQVLKGINLTIAKGESIGVVGSSGAGKTTLIDILMGLLSPSGGKLLIDGADAFNDLPAWQRRLGYVPQNIYLLDDTLRRNIAFGVEDDEINEERIVATIGMAHLDNVLSGLGDGLDTMLGEHGVRLSGGQRQRIGIARALYRDPEVLVFDEATSALDSETEREVTLAIEELSGEKTLIIIAHRLSTVRKCDRLVFMKDGNIVDVGGFNELMDRSPDFRRMVELGDVFAQGGRP